MKFAPILLKVRPNLLYFAGQVEKEPRLPRISLPMSDGSSTSSPVSSKVVLPSVLNDRGHIDT
jgi:hypothetical protein